MCLCNLVLLLILITKQTVTLILLLPFWGPFFFLSGPLLAQVHVDWTACPLHADPGGRQPVCSEITPPRALANKVPDQKRRQGAAVPCIWLHDNPARTFRGRCHHIQDYYIAYLIPHFTWAQKGQVGCEAVVPYGTSFRPDRPCASKTMDEAMVTPQRGGGESTNILDMTKAPSGHRRLAGLHILQVFSGVKVSPQLLSRCRSDFWPLTTLRYVMT